MRNARTHSHLPIADAVPMDESTSHFLDYERARTRHQAAELVRRIKHLGAMSFKAEIDGYAVLVMPVAAANEPPEDR